MEAKDTQRLEQDAVFEQEVDEWQPVEEQAAKQQHVRVHDQEPIPKRHRGGSGRRRDEQIKHAR